MGAQVIQFFLADPQGWKKPTEHPQAAALKASGLTIHIHSPYVFNVATLNNRIRIPSRKLLAQHAEAAGADRSEGADRAWRVTSTHHDDPEIGYDNWRKTFCPGGRRRRVPRRS